MRTTFIAMALFAVSVSAMGKTQPEKIIGIAVNMQPEEYYAEQAEAWSKEAKKHPKSEEAWKNYFMATFYNDKNLEEEEKQLDFVVAEMSEAIPNTYTYYYCMYRYAGINSDYSDADLKNFAESALSMLPEKKDFFDYDVWTVYYYITNDVAHLRSYAKEYLESGIYCDYLIEYSRNELAGMEPGAIVMGTTDVNVIPKILIKYGYGEHTDKDFILTDNLLFDSLYRESVRSRLGITHPCTLPDEIESWDDIYEKQNEIFGAIVEETGRPLYMSHIDIDRYASWYENFSRIGLAHKYYPTPMSDEDCMPLAQEALSHYDMDFFSKPASSEKWLSCNNLAYYALTGFLDIVAHYSDEGDGANCRRLGNVTKSLVNGCNLFDDEERDTVCEEIDNYIVKSELYNF